MKAISITLIYLILVSFILNSTDSFALREIQRTTSDLVKESNDIIVAKCISTETRIDEKYNFVFTYITFEIEDNVKDLIGEEKLVLRMAGGTIGDVVVDVTGLPKFKPDSEYIIFLGDKNVDGYYTIQSFTQGVLKVGVDELTKTKVVLGSPRDITVYKNKTSRVISDKNVILDDFIYSLKKLR